MNTKELSIRLKAAESLQEKLLHHVRRDAVERDSVGVVRSMMIDLFGRDPFFDLKDENDFSTLTIDELREVKNGFDLEPDVQRALEFVHWLGYSIDDDTDDETLADRIAASVNFLEAAAAANYHFDGELLRNGERAISKAAAKRRFVEILCRMGDES